MSSSHFTGHSVGHSVDGNSPDTLRGAVEGQAGNPSLVLGGWWWFSTLGLSTH